MHSRRGYSPGFLPSVHTLTPEHVTTSTLFTEILGGSGGTYRKGRHAFNKKVVRKLCADVFTLQHTGTSSRHHSPRNINPHWPNLTGLILAEYPFTLRTSRMEKPLQAIVGTMPAELCGGTRPGKASRSRNGISCSNCALSRPCRPEFYFNPFFDDLLSAHFVKHKVKGHVKSLYLDPGRVLK